MALDQQSNFTTRQMSYAQRILDLVDDIQRDYRLWNALQLTTVLTDEYLASVPAFAHLSNAKIVALITTELALIAALGDEASTISPYASLIVMRG